MKIKRGITPGVCDWIPSMIGWMHKIVAKIFNIVIRVV